MYADLRDYLRCLEAAGKLRHVTKEVDKDWELGCIARWVFQAVPDQERYGLMFDHIKGCDAPLVVGVAAGSRPIYALGLGVKPEQIYDTWVRALSQPIAPRQVADGPVKAVIRRGAEVDLHELPIAVWTPGKDAAPYLTANCVITRDPEDGTYNIGNYRMMLRDGASTAIQIFPGQHIGLHFAKFKARRQNMPMCVAIGVDPAISYCAVAKIPLTLDEYQVAGGLRGAPIETVKAETCDLQVPAAAEWVLEGEVPWDVMEPEGPFGEYVGYMGLESVKNVFRVTCISHRENPIYQAFLSQKPPSESHIIQSEAIAALMFKHLKYDLGIPGILDVNFTEGSARLHLIVQMKPAYPGHARKTMLIAANLLDANTPKMVTVVDDDIDIRDPEMVEWARASRCDPAEDVIILKDVQTTILDPSTIEIDDQDRVNVNESRVLGSKLLIDATIKKAYSEVSLPPLQMMMDVFERWSQTGLPEIEPPARLLKLLEKHPTEHLVIRPYL